MARPTREFRAQRTIFEMALAASDLVGARPVEGTKGADKGIDGKIVFQGGGARASMTDESELRSVKRE